MKYHFIREVLEDKQIQLLKIHTKDNPADLLTKGLPGEVVGIKAQVASYADMAGRPPNSLTSNSLYILTYTL
ncbi:hypothetical protein DD606_26285 [Enterobacter cloacae complex sp. GF14B]|nr:hypothetical protein DD606_26285 [Enterobacter cloacae complex sp. GF14B]